ncbi:hypothetical protein RN001_013923 [Aquatica leii]|uniref:Cuticle protein n=1 Tax=Aquatica leii TaxID=1421715 RepID=A0AAN7QDJ6_9COLE|nr:hypothetical protein RN001_013923 [Aquatica leii]
MKIFVLIAVVVSAFAQPQVQNPQEAPRPYDFQYKVDNPPTKTYFGQNESGDTAGKVLGSYYTLLPDGRIMTVEYRVDGQSGYVPRISYKQSAKDKV